MLRIADDLYGTAYVFFYKRCRAPLTSLLDYIVQGHRFDIIEEYGCRPTTYVSVPAIFLIWVPPLMLSVIALGFACMPISSCIFRH